MKCHHIFSDSYYSNFRVQTAPVYRWLVRDCCCVVQLALMGVAAEILVSVPGAELHKVVQNVQQLLQIGAFTIGISSPVAGANSEQMVEASVGDFTWPLGKHLPALKAADCIYSFALQHTKSEYLIVVLPAGV